MNTLHTKSAKEKNNLIEKNTPLVHSIVRRYLGRGYEYDDLYQTGCIGLCKAAERFDPSLGYTFSTYAVPLIMGEIKRFLRDDGIIKVSRYYKEVNMKAQLAMQSFLKQHGREPSLSELSEITGIKREDLSAAFDAVRTPVSFYAQSDDGEQNISDKLVSNNFSDDSYVNRITLGNIINSFSKRDKTLIIYRFFKDKTQLETASLLGISQVQVSRIEKKLLERIRVHFK